MYFQGILCVSVDPEADQKQVGWFNRRVELSAGSIPHRAQLRSPAAGVHSILAALLLVAG